MHIQIATFTLNGITEDEYHAACQDETETFAAIDGLLAKTWLRSPETKTYGAVYLWRDREAYEDYVSGEVWAAVASDSSLTDVKSSDFDVFEDLTRATQPGISVC
jgi:heme-degrading monooxygenase HmoA